MAEHTKEFDAFLAIKEGVANNPQNADRTYTNKDGEKKTTKTVTANFRKAEKYTGKDGEEKWSWPGIGIGDGKQTVNLVFVPTGKDGPASIGEKADVLTWKGKGEKPDIEKRVDVKTIEEHVKSSVLADIVKDAAAKYPRVEKEAGAEMDDPEME